ncbi:hypothetical protein VTJ04DRAFT_7695 [Mycothermus thermophilus]|uniref:uncharacterized protein n=1 Tax=Humicola insolens TaxID=85995 RepID=UPI00374319D7
MRSTKWSTEVARDDDGFEQKRKNHTKTEYPALANGVGWGFFLVWALMSWRGRQGRTDRTLDGLAGPTGRLDPSLSGPQIARLFSCWHGTKRTSLLTPCLTCPDRPVPPISCCFTYLTRRR